MKPIEEWRPVVGFEGRYEVSNVGNVRSLDRKVFHKETNSFHQIKGKTLKLRLDGKGYPFVSLGKGSSNQKRVHRLVAEAFIPNPYNKKYIDHINTVRTDNRVENLRWVSASENLCNPISLARRSKRVKQIDPETGIVIKIWPSVSSVERAFNTKNVSACCRGIYKTVKGFSWKHV